MTLNISATKHGRDDEHGARVDVSVIVVVVVFVVAVVVVVVVVVAVVLGQKITSFSRSAFCLKKRRN